MQEPRDGRDSMSNLRACRRTFWLGLALFAGLALPSAGQEPGEICIGRFCGLDRGFEARHCHIRPGGDPDGDDWCWSSEPFDLVCEELGYTVNLACPVQAGAAVGAVGQQLAVLSGYNQFRSQIVKPAAARKAEEDAQAAQEAEEGDEEDEGAGYAVHLSEITTAFEYEDWELAGQQGETVGARFDWLRETETGMLWGASASYQEASPDRGESTELLNGQLSVGHTFGMGGMDWSWGAFGTVTDISGPASDTLFGAGGRLAFSRYFDGGRVLSGGVLGQYQTADELDDDLVNVGAGAAYGFPVGERFALDFELYAVNIIEPEVVDDTFYTGAGMVSVYFSPRFTLTLGARVLEGIDRLDSITYTVGGSTRFW